MSIQVHKKLLLAIALVALPAVQTYANTCGDESPLKLAIGEKAYFNMDYALESNKAVDTTTLNTILAKPSFRNGDGLRYKCVGQRNYEKSISTSFELDDIRLTDSVSIIKLVALEEHKRKSTLQSITLPFASDWRQTADNVFTSTVLQRRATKAGGSLFVELSSSIEAKRDKLVVTQTSYIHGKKDSWVTWNIEY